MPKVTLREVREYLRSKSHAQLVEDIVVLYGKLDGVKEFITFQMGRGFSDELLEKQRAIIQKEFFPARGFGQARLSIARKAITEYKKTSPNIPGVVELMVFYVEIGVRFTNDYGDISESFYNSMESMYKQALKSIIQYGLQEQFRERCKQIVSDTRDIGWGFHDTLSDLYHDILDEEE